MALILRQSTAVDVLIGPFVDSGNGYTSEEGLSPAVELSKNGQALAAKSDVTTPVVDDFGYYNCELDATDTNTVGTLVLAVEGSATALPVRHEFQVVEEAVYDQQYASSAAGAVRTDTISEYSQGAPPLAPTLEEAINYLYRHLVRNKVVVDTNTANQAQSFLDNSSTIAFEADITDSSSVFTRAKAQTGA